MTDSPFEKPVRRVHPVAKALHPVRRDIGALQEATVFLLARSDYTLRRSGDPVTVDEVEEKRKALLLTQALLDATVDKLPESLRADTRLHDTRAALARLEASLANLASKAQIEVGGNQRPSTPRDD
ncbi:MAG: hypothetical protein EOP21_03215 [Hyphomicrobiales bacterium]|nr:MAG: hypothetical protein EOP21_03215 [Hyphomicrobiales bacterium]